MLFTDLPIYKELVTITLPEAKFYKDDGTIYQGTGKIEFNQGKITLKIYDLPDTIRFPLGLETPYGKLPQKEHLFSFIGKDELDRTWSSSNILGLFPTFLMKQKPSLNAHCNTLELKYKTGLSSDVKQYYFSKATNFPSLPFFAHIKGNSLDFGYYHQYHKDVNECTTVFVKAKEKKHDLAFQCIKSAYSLFHGQNWEPEVIVQKNKIIFRSVHRSSSNLTTVLEDTIENLHSFIQGFSNIEEQQQKKFAAAINQALNSACCNTENTELSFCAMIEKLLTDFYKKHHHESNSFTNALNDLENLVSTLNATKQDKKKLKNKLQQAKKRQAKELLDWLATVIAIKDCHIVAWNKIRNPRAHGGQWKGNSPSRLQENFANLFTLISLFHILCFDITRFSGSYRDLTTEGFPTKDYSPSENSPLHR